MKTIALTKFALRHFDKSFGGTKILDMSPEEFETTLLKNASTGMYLKGYAPFCELLVIKNFTDARVGSLPITLENYQYLHSGYSARKDSELPVFPDGWSFHLKNQKQNG